MTAMILTSLPVLKDASAHLFKSNRDVIIVVLTVLFLMPEAITVLYLLKISSIRFAPSLLKVLKKFV